MNPTLEFQAYANAWQNDNEYNNRFHAELADRVNADPLLKAHRDWVEANQFGFGDRPFHYVWKMLVDQMPQLFSFLEIGVFKGQVVSLIKLLARQTGKDAYVAGVSTLTNTPDKRCKYPQGNYVNWINQIFNAFSLDVNDRFTIVAGKSSDVEAVKQTAHPWNMIYIDGGHDYADVAFDIKTYAPRVAMGGFLIVDDASINRLNIGSCWPGLEDVSQAVKDHLDNDPRFKFLFACGHINIFQRVNP